MNRVVLRKDIFVILVICLKLLNIEGLKVTRDKQSQGDKTVNEIVIAMLVLKIYLIYTRYRQEDTIPCMYA